VICEFCGYEYEDGLGRYGCPDCLGEGPTDQENDMSRKATQKANRIASQKAAKRPHGESSGNALGLSARTLKVLDEMRAQLREALNAAYDAGKAAK